MYEHKDLYVIDFSEVNNIMEMHMIIRDSLDFPDYYGRSWDAFWDCITDMYGEKINIEILSYDRVREKFGTNADALVELLHDFKHNYDDEYCDDISVKIHDGGKTYYLD